jgi:hypothetical protein
VYESDFRVLLYLKQGCIHYFLNFSFFFSLWRTIDAMFTILRPESILIPTILQFGQLWRQLPLLWTPLRRPLGVVTQGYCNCTQPCTSKCFPQYPKTSSVDPLSFMTDTKFDTHNPYFTLYLFTLETKDCDLNGSKHSLNLICSKHSRFVNVILIWYQAIYSIWNLPRFWKIHSLPLQICSAFWWRVCLC